MFSKGRVAKCCINPCDDFCSKRHRFLKNEPEIFKKWLNNVNSCVLKDKSPEYIYKTYYVCNRHFEEKDIVPGTRRGLKKNAVPTLFLNKNITSVIPTTSVVSTREMLLQHSTSTEPDAEAPLISRNAYDVGLANYHKHVELKDPTQNYMEKANLQSSLSCKRKRPSILQHVGCTRANQLTPAARKLHQIVRYWSKKNTSLQYRLRSYRKRLKDALALANSSQCANLLNHVNATTYKFIMLQEKILPLTLLKSCRRGYKLLSKIFCLPSPRTLTELLNKIPFRPGINEQLVTTLTETVQKMTKRDRNCSVVFDEMTIASLLQYQRRDDIIEGFEDVGTRRKPLLADHATVFMLKGLYRQWKQPLMYAFTSGPMNQLI